MKIHERDYLVSEFPLAFHLLHETRLAAYRSDSSNYSDHMRVIDQALNAAVEYGALRCLVRLLREDPDKLISNFIADDEECDPEEDGSDMSIMQ